MVTLIVLCLIQFALGRPQGQISDLKDATDLLQRGALPAIPLEIWQKYESLIPKEYYEIGKHDEVVRSSFWQAALRHESGPYLDLGQALVPGWLGFVPTSVHVENNYTVPLPGGGVGFYISGTFEGPGGIKGNFGSSSSMFVSGGTSSSGMSWSTLVHPGGAQEGLKYETMMSDGSERAQNAFISQTEGGSGNQVANINQHGSSSNKGGQSAGINQSGSSHAQTANINQGGEQSSGHGYSTQHAGVNQASSQGQHLGVGQSQSPLNSASNLGQSTGLSSLGHIQQAGQLGARPGYNQLTGLNQAAGISQYQFQKPGSTPTSAGSLAQSSAFSSATGAGAQSFAHSNAQSTVLSNSGQLQSAGINNHQGLNTHDGFNTASGTNNGPNNYNGPNSGSVAHLQGRPQDSVTIVGPSHPVTGSAGSIHVNS